MPPHRLHRRPTRTPQNRHQKVGGKGGRKKISAPLHCSPKIILAHDTNCNTRSWIKLRDLGIETLGFVTRSVYGIRGEYANILAIEFVVDSFIEMACLTTGERVALYSQLQNITVNSYGNGKDKSN